MTGLRSAAIGATLLFAAGCAEASVADDTTVLEKAYASCTEDGDPAGWTEYLDLADEGHTLIVDTGTEDESNSSLAYLCVTLALDTSEAVQSSIETTTSMMGRQTRTDGDLTYEWSYHPDNGLHVVITD